MEPQLPSPDFKHEASSSEAPSPESVPSSAPVSPESLPSQPIEQLRSVESHEKHRPTTSTNSPTATPTLPVTSNVTDDDQAQTVGPAVVSDDTNDDDVIEKQWVDKSKKIVKDTKGDPYRKEHEVSKLQADFIYKKYGKQVKIPDDV